MSEIVQFEDEENIETFETVIRMISFGKKPGEIEAETNVPPRIQRKFYEEFMRRANDPYRVEERSKTIISELDVAFSDLISKMDRVISDAEDSGESRLMKDAIKEQANIVKMRAEVLTKAGFIGAEKIGEDIAKFKHERAILMKILSEMKGAFPEAVKYMHRRLAEEQQNEEIIDVE